MSGCFSPLPAYDPKCLALVADRSLSAARVAPELTGLIGMRGKPHTVVSDNGTELTSSAILRLSQERRIEWRYIHRERLRTFADLRKTALPAMDGVPSCSFRLKLDGPILLTSLCLLVHVASMDRRNFLAICALAASRAVHAQSTPASRNRSGQLTFQDLPSPVDFHAHVTRPVRLASAEVLVVGGEHQFVRVRSTDGDEGVIKANSRMEEVMSLFHQIAVPAFSKDDLRDLPTIIDQVYTAQYKFAGLAFWTAIGHLELAVWDMLGKAMGKRCVDMMGLVLRTEIPIYVSSLDRKSTGAQEAEAVAKAVAMTGARGAKIKVGGRMSRNVDAFPGRSEDVVKAVRKAMGDDFVIYADANGSYDAPAAIELVRMLEDYGVAVLEEPCPFEDFEMTAQVTRAARRIRIAGGEQDSAMERWRWYLDNKGLDVLQPDFMYNGGMLRTLRVQRMAAERGVGVAPHYPRNGMETVELLHFAAQASNLYGLQEYRLKPRTLDFPHSPVIEPKNGVLTLPEGPGFGVTIDPAIWKDAVKL